jgi:hypothetical protein
LYGKLIAAQDRSEEQTEEHDMAASSTHEPAHGPDSPLSPAESLTLIADQEQRTREGLRPNPLGLFLPWGLAYLVAFGAVWLDVGPGVLPSAVTTVVVAVAFAAAMTTALLTMRRAFRGVAGPSQRVGALYGWSWPLGFAVLGVANSQLVGYGVPAPVISLIWSGSALVVVGLLMLAGGLLWPGSGQYALGVWILISAAVSVVVGYPANFLVLALAGGGGFIVLAVVAHLRMRRGA